MHGAQARKGYHAVVEEDDKLDRDVAVPRIVVEKPASPTNYWNLFCCG